LTLRQLAPLFGISKPVAHRIVDHLGPLLALQPRKRFRKDTVHIVDGILVPTRDHTVAEQSKNYRCSTNHQVTIDADTRLVVMVGRPLPGNRNDCKAWAESGAKAAVGQTTTIADGGYPGTGLVMPYRRRKGEDLPAWKEEHNGSHKQVRARVEHRDHNAAKKVKTAAGLAVAACGAQVRPGLVLAQRDEVGSHGFPSEDRAA
jgi:hypothetical protein